MAARDESLTEDARFGKLTGLGPTEARRDSPPYRRHRRGPPQSDHHAGQPDQVDASDNLARDELKQAATRNQYAIAEMRYARPGTPEAVSDRQLVDKEAEP